MKKFWILTGIVLLIVSTGRLKGQDNLKSLLPPGNEYGNWIIQDSAKVFTGEDLFSLIDGGADIYLEYGFDEAVSCKYRNPLANKIQVEIYKMKNSDAAYGIFSFSSNYRGESLDLGDGSYMYDYYLDFWKYNYFVRCSFGDKTDGINDTLKMFASGIDQKIKGKGKLPQLVHVLDRIERNVSQIKFLKGEIGLDNVFNFGHGTISGYDEAITARSDELMIFVFHYDNAKSAREWFASARGKMSYYKNKFTDYIVEEDGFTVKDKNGKYLSFKPYKQFFLVVKGLSWNDAGKLFSEIISGIDTTYNE